MNRGVVGIPQIQLLPMNSNPLPLSYSAAHQDSTPSTTFYLRALKLSAYDDAPQQPANQLDSTYVELVRRAYISNPPPIGNQMPRRPMNLIDNSSFTDARQNRGRTHEKLFASQASFMLGNWRASVVLNFQLNLDLWVDDVCRRCPGSEADRKDMGNRMKAWLTPAYIKNFRNQHSLTLGHPMFRIQHGYRFNLHQRIWAVQNLRFLYPLLIYLIETPGNNKINNIGAAPLLAFSAFEARVRLYAVAGSTTWRHVLKGNNDLLPRTMPILRFIQRARYRMSGLDPLALGGSLDGSLLTPFPSEYTTPRFYFDSLTLVTFILPGLLLPHRGRAPIPKSKLMIPNTSVSSSFSQFWLQANCSF